MAQLRTTRRRAARRPDPSATEQPDPPAGSRRLAQPARETSAAVLERIDEVTADARG